MANTASAVLVGVTGVVYHGATTATAPTNATGTAASGFTALGYIDDSGITESPSVSTNKIKAWQNGDIVRVVQTEHDVTYKFSAIETNDKTVALYYGNGTAASGVVNGTALANGSWIFDVVDGSHTKRIYLPLAQITDRDPIKYVNGDPFAYGFTVTAYPDASGNKAYYWYV